MIFPRVIRLAVPEYRHLSIDHIQAVLMENGIGICDDEGKITGYKSLFVRIQTHGPSWMLNFRDLTAQTGSFEVKSILEV